MSSPDALSAYVPSLLTRRIALGVATARTEGGAAVFADISGFTPLAERLSRLGPAGAEALTSHLNNCFGGLIDAVYANGGEVAKFAGDALLAWFPDGAGDRAATVGRATICAHAFQAAIGGVGASAMLTLRVGVGAGEMVAGAVGGHDGRWELLIAGGAIERAIAAQSEASVGAVVVDRSAPRGAPAAPRGDHGGGASSAHDASVNLTSLVPPVILARVAAGQAAWIAELRSLTVLFIHVPGLDEPESFGGAHVVTRTIQENLARYEGSLNKLSVDDKGVSFLAAFGLPPLAHDDDATRAVRAALAIRAGLTRLGHTPSMGVTTGRVFAGIVGNPLRCEYTIIGNAVNLAARLMMAAAGEVLCDGPTANVASDRVAFAPPVAMTVKGRSDTIATYRARAERAASVVEPATPWIGREHERAQLDRALAGLAEGASTVFIVEGEAGIGKSRLVDELGAIASGTGAETLSGAADAVERSTAWFAWRPVVRGLFGLDARSTDDESRLAAIEARLAEHELASLAPLLSPFLAHGLDDNTVTAAMDGEVRFDNTCRVVLALLQARAAARPVVVVIEDAHWLDSASWRLLARAARDVSPLVVALTLRPLTGDQPPEIALLAGLPQTQHIALSGLGPLAIRSLVSHHGAGLPEPVVVAIIERSGGSPFFAGELAEALSRADLGREGALDAALHLPVTIQAVVNARIDRLPARELLALKVAAVIGQTFLFSTLHSVHPLESDRVQLDACVDALCRERFTTVETDGADPNYEFRHAITRDAAYELLLYSQRRDLHRAVAQSYERAHAGALQMWHPLLAYHWQRAEVADKAIDHLEAAAEPALRSFANREAVAFLDAAIALVDAGKAEVSAARRAVWERQLGHAHLKLGNLERARGHLDAAITLHGHPVAAARSSFRLGVGLLREAAKQAWFQLGPAPREATPEARERARESARAFGRRAELYYLANDPPRLVDSFLRALNLAERGGPCPELAYASANLALGASVAPMPRLAEFYRRRATSVAAQLGDPIVALDVERLTTYPLFAAGQFTHVRETLTRVAARYAEIGDRSRWGECSTVLALAMYHQAAFDDAERVAAAVRLASRRADDALQESWGATGQGTNLWRLGRLPEAEQALNDALALLERAPDRINEIAARGALVQVRLARGDLRGALRGADVTARLIAQSQPTSFYLIEGYAGAAEPHIAAATAATDGAVRRRHLASARAAVAALYRFARVFQIARPRARRLDGRVAALRGDERRARALFEQACREGAALAMPHEERMATQALAELRGGTQPS